MFAEAGHVKVTAREREATGKAGVCGTVVHTAPAIAIAAVTPVRR